jgi:hypothetical protein
MDEAAAARLVERSCRAPSVSRRVELVSARFLGTPYQLGPLGEGPGHLPDPDPLFRWDAVDCLTFVEEVLALSRACSLTEAEQVLQQIRYAGNVVAYAERNHVVETQWLPNNIRKGFVQDITAALAGRVAHLAPVQGAPPTILLSPDQLLASGDQVPSGALVFVYRRVPVRREAWASHAGLLVQTPRGLRVRHASSARHRVVEERLEHFVGRYTREGNWPLAGFQVVKPLPGPRCPGQP